MVTILQKVKFKAFLSKTFKFFLLYLICKSLLFNILIIKKKFFYKIEKIYKKINKQKFSIAQCSLFSLFLSNSLSKEQGNEKTLAVTLIIIIIL